MHVGKNSFVFPALILLIIIQSFQFSSFITREKIILNEIQNNQLKTESTSFPLVFSRLIGGSDYEYCRGLCVDSENNIIITGSTYSENFPVIDGGTTTNISGTLFAAKFTNNGTLMWSTTIGEGHGFAIEVDSDNNIYISGYTTSNDFPVKNAFDDTYNGERDGFIMKLSPLGTLIWSTFIGGGDYDIACAIEGDSDENLVVIGETESSDFPTLKAYDFSYNGEKDLFVSKFSSNGSLLWSSFLGGTNQDGNLYEYNYGIDLTIDTKNSIIISGSTYSEDFPIVNEPNTTYGGYSDIFIAKFYENGSLGYSSFLGGSNNDYGSGITSDISGNYYITGYTWSSNFPVKNAHDNISNGGLDIFITKFFQNNSLQWSTFLGSDGPDESWGIAADLQGNVFITGKTSSGDFPLVNPLESNHNGVYDFFISGFCTNGSIGWSTFFGGTSQNEGTQIVLDSEYRLITMGNTYSSDFPITIQGTYPLGDRDAFICTFRNSLMSSKPYYSDTNGFAKDIFISENFAYVADGTAGLAIIDVSIPIILGEPIYTTGVVGVEDVFIFEKYAYIIDRSGVYFSIVEISDPTNSTKIFEEMFAEAFYVTVSEDYAYITCDWNSLAIFNVTDPWNPGSRSSYSNIADHTWQMSIYKKWLYIAGGNSGLVMMNISDPKNPGSPIYHSSLGYIQKLFVTEDYAFTLNDSGTISIVDITDPTSSVLIHQFPAGASVTDIYVEGKTLFVAEAALGLLIFDISDPTYPNLTGEISINGSAFGVFVSGDYAFIAIGENGLAAIDISNYRYSDTTIITTTTTTSTTTSSEKTTTSKTTSSTETITTTTTISSNEKIPSISMITSGFSSMLFCIELAILVLISRYFKK